MDKLVLHPSTMSQWQSLVYDAQNACNIELPESLESYLVFLLMRFTERPEIAREVVAIDFLESYHQSQHLQQQTLRDIGDKCLLFTGLFPKRARQRRVRIGYYVKIGQSAYSSLSSSESHETSELFLELCETFVPMMDILQTMREIDTQEPSLDPLEAEELWSDTGSTHALQTLKQFTQMPIDITSFHNPDQKH